MWPHLIFMCQNTFNYTSKYVFLNLFDVFLFHKILYATLLLQFFSPSRLYFFNISVSCVSINYLLLIVSIRNGQIFNSSTSEYPTPTYGHCILFRLMHIFFFFLDNTCICFSGGGVGVRTKVYGYLMFPT
jgi:hypothetical protein